MKLTNKTIEITQDEIAEVVRQMNEKTISQAAAIRKLFAEGFAVKEVSLLLGISYQQCYNNIQNEVFKHSLEVDRGTRGSGGVKKEAVLVLLHKGLTIRQASEELKMLYNSVWQIAKDAGLTPKQKAAKKAGPAKNAPETIEGVA
jgi:molybdenum-dependent DNA-binding transcriptional regulator ModE